ncbi:hypothetical protein BU16DRAFT_532968 [Lophium mytilinum]|uniref:Uncharacterized protein n=1 Tax=Lophium mytilinum TaxID=390894 RepID=A0A6A6RGQ1_9PEZI|nr:hypothetical protein BU16DRAFT_532968 [Lophium mytilinum]
METELGEQFLGDDKCTQCKRRGFECWAYSKEALGQVNRGGVACARCRHSPISRCSLSPYPGRGKRGRRTRSEALAIVDLGSGSPDEVSDEWNNPDDESEQLTAGVIRRLSLLFFVAIQINNSEGIMEAVEGLASALAVGRVTIPYCKPLRQIFSFLTTPAIDTLLSVSTIR